MNAAFPTLLATGSTGTLGVNRRNSRRALAWVALLCLAFAFEDQARATREYEVKAAFLFNFTKFVEWPKTAFASPTSPVIIGIVGEDPFGETLPSILSGETVQGRPLEIRHYRAEDNFEGCHLLFVSRSESRRWDDILGRLQGRGILTVSETGDFTRRGGMVDLVILEQNVRFEINLAVLEKAGLKASSKLLAVAAVVRR